MIEIKNITFIIACVYFIVFISQFMSFTAIIIGSVIGFVLVVLGTDKPIKRTNYIGSLGKRYIINVKEENGRLCLVFGQHRNQAIPLSAADIQKIKEHHKHFLFFEQVITKE